jgi:hypothetical protein
MKSERGGKKARQFYDTHIHSHTKEKMIIYRMENIYFYPIILLLPAMLLMLP